MRFARGCLFVVVALVAFWLAVVGLVLTLLAQLRL